MQVKGDNMLEIRYTLTSSPRELETFFIEEGDTDSLVNFLQKNTVEYINLRDFLTILFPNKTLKTIKRFVIGMGTSEYWKLYMKRFFLWKKVHGHGIYMERDGALKMYAIFNRLAISIKRN